MEHLNQLIERVGEIRRRLEHLRDAVHTSKDDHDALTRIEEERATLEAELVAIGERSQELIDDPIVRNAVGQILEGMRTDAQPQEMPTPPVGDALEQAREILDGHADEIGRTTEKMMSQVLPMVERAIDHHSKGTTSGEEHAGLDLFSIGIEMSEMNDTEGMLGLTIGHLVSLPSAEALVEIIQRDDSAEQLANAVNGKLHALALVAYGRHIPVDDDGTEHRDQAEENKVTTIVHPSGMVAYIRKRIGDTYGEPFATNHMVTEGNVEEMKNLLENHGRIPYALAYLYASTIQHIMENR